MLKESSSTSRRKLPILKILKVAYRFFTLGVFVFAVFYFSLLSTSRTVNENEERTINRAIAILEAKGFIREVVLLRHFTLFRGSDNWLNGLIPKENAFASTNCPFSMITLYEDFYTRAADDTERAMILLHEVQHLQAKNETEAYRFVWENRHKLGWTILSHGTTETFITVELQTRENTPDLFSCPDRHWNDCTETPKPVNREVIAER